MQNDDPVMSTHRIRDITGIRIHQLTLPQSLSYASKLIHSPYPSAASDTLAGPSSPSLQRTRSHNEPSRRERRISTSTLPDVPPIRERSASTSYGRGRNVRTGRPRAPTLAGAAIEQALEQSPVLDDSQKEGVAPARRLAKCFVVLKLPATCENQEEEGHIRRRTASSSSSPVISPTTPRRSRPGLSPSISKNSLSNGDVPRQRTISHPTRPDFDRPSSYTNRTPLARATSERSRTRSSTDVKITRPSVSTHPSFSSLRAPLSPRIPELSPSVPFYISPIHKPSTHPRFVNLSTDDFAPWLTVEESAATVITLEVWYQDEHGWKMLEGVGGEIQLGMLKRIQGEVEGTEENTVQLVFTSDPKAIWYLPDPFVVGKDSVQEDAKPVETAQTRRESVQGVMERSKRETRMRRGAGVGSLHQLVNMQSVIMDTKRDVENIQRNIDKMLLEDVDHRAIKRDISEREERCRWILEKSAEIEKSTREARAHVVLREQALEERRSLLDEANAHAELLHGQATQLVEQIDLIDTERSGLLGSIHHWRTHHVQTLDSLFPIVPLHPPTLLYTILNVPLPIPIGPKDPAPPLTLAPGTTPEGIGKIDEKTTAAALGYVALVVQILGNLGGAAGGLPYPVTSAGSRSLVKDVVSVMQGPRSFPLYAKGVERYRYEYAVFLLNKNIETLMQECNSRLLDLRHTLPNLKMLLLTLSSPQPVVPTYPLSRSFTSVDSRTSSRATSGAWPRPFASPGSGVSSKGSSPVKPGTAASGYGSLGLLGSPSSPVRKSGLRRSLVSRDMDASDEDEDEMESVSAL